MRLTIEHVFIVLVLCAAFLTATARADRFLLATFNNGEQQLRILGSTNASEFTGYAQGIVYTPPPGNNLRDPSIVHHLGRYHLCHTAGNFGGTNYFSVLVSDNLTNWTRVTDVSMAAVGDVRWTWAPEWFLDDDGSLHVFVSASTTPEISTRHVIYELHPLNAELTQWSTPTPVTGPAFPAWTGLETGRVGAYDAYVVKRSGAYHMFHFDSVTSCIEVARSTNSLTGPYEPLGTNNWQGIGLYKEGPTVMYLGGGRWRMIYADAIFSYLNHTDSTNNWATWSPPARVTLPGAPTNFTVNHGTLIMPPGGLEAGLAVSPQGAGQFNLTFHATEGDSYRLATSTNLAAWAPSMILGPTTNGPASQTIQTSGEEKRFWRLERLLP
jgi:hypothetical protein